MQICIDLPRADANLHRAPSWPNGSMQICIDPPSPWEIDANLHRSPQGLWDRCKFASMDRCKCSSISLGLGGSTQIWMQICIDPPSPGKIDANFHRSPQGLTDRCKFESIPQVLGRSMQICIDPLRAWGIDANLHRSVRPRGDNENLYRPIDATLHPPIDANLHRSPMPLGDQCKFASMPPALRRSMQRSINSALVGWMQIYIDGSMQICIDPSMQISSLQICIDPLRTNGIAANLHRSPKPVGHRCKFASIPSGLVGSMQSFIDAPRAWVIYANLHRSPEPWGDRCKFPWIPSARLRSMQICIDPPWAG